MTRERIIIINLVKLIEAWMNGILREQGFKWIKLPPALQAAKDYIKDTE